MKRKVIIKRKVAKNIPYIIVVRTTDNRIGFYDGTGFDTLKSKAKPYANKGIATIQGQKFVGVAGVHCVHIVPANASLNIVKNASLKTKGIEAPKKRKKNPIAGSKKRRISKAQNLFEDFTGHNADTFEMVKLPEYDTGLKVGKVLGIMYETTRDGNKENYIHEFKKTSQPDFAVSHDGQQIFLIGGSYLFKDSGINDT